MNTNTTTATESSVGLCAAYGIAPQEGCTAPRLLAAGKPGTTPQMHTVPDVSSLTDVSQIVGMVLSEDRSLPGAKERRMQFVRDASRQLLGPDATMANRFAAKLYIEEFYAALYFSHRNGEAHSVTHEQMEAVMDIFGSMEVVKKSLPAWIQEFLPSPEQLDDPERFKPGFKILISSDEFDWRARMACKVCRPVHEKRILERLDF